MAKRINNKTLIRQLESDRNTCQELIEIAQHHIRSLNRRKPLHDASGLLRADLQELIERLKHNYMSLQSKIDALGD